MEGQDAGWRRKTNNLHHLNIHFQLHHFLLHYVSRQLRRYKCVIFIYKALLRFFKKPELNFIEKRRGEKTAVRWLFSRRINGVDWVHGNIPYTAAFLRIEMYVMGLWTRKTF